jgi:hypothetical protein
MTHGDNESQVLANALATLVAWTEPRTGEVIEEDEKQILDAYKTASKILGGLQEGRRDPWSGVIIHKLIRKSSRFVVFLDDRLNIKWWWVLRPDMAIIAAVQARITELTHESAFLVDERRTQHSGARPEIPESVHTREAENIRCVIGEAMALALNEATIADCEKVFSEAENYIAVAKDQRCRPKFVGTFLLVVLAFGAVAIARYMGLLGHALEMNVAVQHGMEAAVAGAFGALISAVSRTTQLRLEPAAGTSGIAVEAVARALIGAAGGILVNFAFEGGFLMKDALNASHPNLEDSVRLFLCLSAGISERILPALVGKAETLVTKPERSVPTKSAPKKKSLAKQVDHAKRS